MPRLALGTQGWSYRDWVGPLYAPGTRPQEYLRAYAREFATVEIDSTFYATPEPERLERWAAAVPDGFTFALKLDRAITLERRLVNCADAVARFFAAAQVLGPKLEAVLVQLPPDFGPAEWPALRAFVALIPAGPRVAVEVRDPHWFATGRRAELHALLAAAGIALTVTDGTFVDVDLMLGAFAQPAAPFAYIRWLGRRDAVSRFDRVQVDRSARIERWAAGIRAAGARLERVCGYANNHYMGHGPATVRAMYRALGIEHIGQQRPKQTELFPN